MPAKASDCEVWIVSGVQEILLLKPMSTSGGGFVLQALLERLAERGGARVPHVWVSLARRVSIARRLCRSAAWACSSSSVSSPRRSA